MSSFDCPSGFEGPRIRALRARISSLCDAKLAERARAETAEARVRLLETGLANAQAANRPLGEQCLKLTGMLRELLELHTTKEQAKLDLANLTKALNGDRQRSERQALSAQQNVRDLLDIIKTVVIDEQIDSQLDRTQRKRLESIRLDYDTPGML